MIWYFLAMDAVHQPMAAAAAESKMLAVVEEQMSLQTLQPIQGKVFLQRLHLLLHGIWNWQDLLVLQVLAEVEEDIHFRQ
jgi:hypothetical protein